MDYHSFTERELPSIKLPDIIAGGTPELGSPEDRRTWLKVLIGYSSRLPSDLDREDKWPLLPEGISRWDKSADITDNGLRQQFALEAAEEWLNAAMITKSLQQLSAGCALFPGRFREVRIIYPSPLSRGQSQNVGPEAFANTLKSRLAGIEFPLPFTFETQDNSSRSLDDGIFTIEKGARGVPKSAEPKFELQKRFLYAVQRIVRQNMVAGKVREDALYWIIDDGVTVGSTVCNYINHIYSSGGVVGAVTCLSKRYNGAEILKPNETSLELLRKTVDSHWENDYARIGVPFYRLREDLNNQMGRLGMHIGDWEDLSAALVQTTMTNQEILLLASYFMAPDNPELQAKLKVALERSGSVSGEGSESYVARAAKLTEGTLYEFHSFLNFAHADRVKDAVAGSEHEHSIRSAFPHTPHMIGLRSWDPDTDYWA